MGFAGEYQFAQFVNRLHLQGVQLILIADALFAQGLFGKIVICFVLSIVFRTK